MMVQGWTANSFSTLSGRNAFQAKEPIEEKLTLNGTVFRENNKRQPLPNMKLSIKMYSKEGAALSGECVTDSVGHFAFVSNEDYVGNWIAQFTTRNENDGAVLPSSAGLSRNRGRLRAWNCLRRRRNLGQT